MNHTYVLVWSPTLQSYIPAPETARRRGKSSSGKALRPAAVVLSAALLASPAFAQAPPPLAANALPTGGQVVAGQASIGQSGNQMTITQGSDKAILNWNGFNIGQDARVQFQQPGSASVALNRVVGSDASRIQGQLSANGQVWLVNPNGVVFGAGSRVDVGGLVASTLNITDKDFLDGKAIFNRDGATGGIVNEGHITAVGDGEQGGLIALLAPTVRNDGVLTAKLGNVALAAGDRITLNAGAGGLLQVEVQPGTLRTLVENRQLIVADGGQVVMTGKAADALSGSVVANTGTVQARSLATREGRIMLLADGDHGSVQVSGLLDASAAQGQGGSIEVTGQQVVLAGATLDASGATGGGEIKVGGGWQGGGALARAKTTSVDAGSSLKADATQNGDGGTVVVWSDDKTRYAGQLSAKGGSTGGKGGKAEVSGKAVLEFKGTADLSAAKGRFGDLLLDPHNLTIVGGSGGTVVAAADDSTLGADTLTGLLAGAYVTVSTTSGGGSQAGDITVNAPVTWGADTTLTLEAAGDIAIKQNITATGASAGLELLYGSGKDYQLSDGASITLSGAGAKLAIGLTALALPNYYTLVRNVTALQAIPASSSGPFALAQDIDASSLSAGAGFAPIADFGGTFAGLGHVINGLTINRPTQDHVGLFGRIKVGGSTVRDVGLLGANVIGQNFVGALVGYDTGGTPITRAYASGEVKGTNYVGGLIGYNQSTLSQSNANVTVTGLTTWAGGLVGSNGGTITNSYATGAVGGTFAVGGLAGQSGGAITNSYATGAVSGTSYVGGLAGDSSGAITNSYATGAVSGTSIAGGLVGINIGPITNSYATGAVSGTSAGGLVGEIGAMGGTAPTNSFYATTNAAGSPINAGGSTTGAWTGNVNGTGKTYAELISPPTFAGWNPAIWTLARGAGAAGYETGLPALTGVTRSADVVRSTLFQAGMGTALSPYGITDWQQLANINSVLAGGYTFNLSNDLDSSSSGYGGLAGATANGGLGWKPLGDVATPFTGTFDGQNRSISGLTINRPLEDDVGLFGRIGGGAIVRNIGVVGATVIGRYQAGALAGFGATGSTITHAYASGDVKGERHVGGLVGANRAALSQSYSSSTVTANDTAGGLVGLNEGTIANAYATGAVSGNTVGGLVGSNSGSIDHVYATGPVSGTATVGGLAGFHDSMLGGAVTNAFYATTDVGGSTINNGGATAGIWTGNANGTGKTYEELKSPATFTGWDTSVWTLARGAGAEGYETGLLPALTGVTRVADMARTTLFQGGMGVAGNPYGITDWQQLANINQVLGGAYTFNLNNNLDGSSSGYVGLASATANAGLGWKPLGDGTAAFTGTFDGQDHTISGLVIKRPLQDAVGLFGYTGSASVVRNIGVLSANVIGRYDVGALAGTGGGTITRAYASGEVKGEQSVGGLAGSIQSDLSQSYANATVTGSRERTGGLVGTNLAGIFHSYATGAVSGNIATGGLVGFNDGTIDHAYSTGAVSGASSNGGLVGLQRSDPGTITNTFYATTNIGGGTINNGGSTGGSWDSNAESAGKTYSELMSPSTFTGWSNTIWTFGGGNSVAGYEVGLPSLIGVTRAIDMQRTTLFQGGMGIAGNPYGITDWQQLANINSVLGGGYTFNLSNNLDGSSSGYAPLASATANGGLGWKPLGDSTTPFTGTFDGQDRTISGLVINRPTQNNVGLFGLTNTGSMIRNVGSVGGSVIGSYSVGGLVGENNGTLSHVYATGAVQAVDTYDGQAGGLVGVNRANGAIDHAYATGDVTGSRYVGGLVGVNSTPSSISQSYATGSVTGTDEGVGGLAGLNQGIINQAYATGVVNGWARVGGLVGLSSTGSISEAYATGSVTGMYTSLIGGLVGESYATITASFYATTTSGGSTINNGGVTAGIWTGNGNGAGKTFAELMSPATFTGWNNASWTLARGASVAGYEAGLLPALTGVTRAIDMQRTTLFQGGMGIAGNPYGITDWQQLANINQVLGGGYTFNLNNNLDGSSTGYAGLASATADGGLGWKTLGDNTWFTGTFDGQDHTISGLVINRPTQENVGLFGLIGNGSAVRNIGLLGANVTGRHQVGALVGNGIAGSTITRAFAAGDVKGDIDVGGLVGWNQSNLSQSYANVTVTGSSRTGGLVGTNASTITNSYATGAVSGSSDVGGLAGLNVLTIDHAYATGAVWGTTRVGGLIGSTDLSGAPPTNAFYATTNAAGATINNGGTATGLWTGNANGTGKTMAELMSAATFGGWGSNLTTVGGSTATWRIYEGNTTPLLRSFLQAATVTADLSAASKTYDGTVASGTAPYATNVAGSLSGSLNYVSTGANAGSYTTADSTLTLGGLYSGPQGYDISYAPASLAITPVVLLPPAPPATPSITGALTGTVSKTYDGTTSATLGSGNFLLSGWVSTDGAIVTQTTGRYDSADAGSGKTVTVDLARSDYQATGTTNLGNYVLPTRISGAVGTINKAALTVSANDAGKTYDGQAWRGGNGVSYSGFVNGESASVLTGALNYGGTSQGAVDVGSYVLTANGLNSGNYAIDYRNGTLSVASQTGGGNTGGGNTGNGNTGGGNPGNGNTGNGNQGGSNTGGDNASGSNPGGGNAGVGNPAVGNTGGNTAGNDQTLVADASSPSGGNLWRALNRAAPTSMLPPQDGGPDRGRSVPNLSVAPNYIRLKAED